MSSGHGHTGLHLQHEELERALKAPRFVELCRMPVTINYDYDMPYLAGYSTDGKTRYVDRHFKSPGALPGSILIEGKLVDVLPYLVGKRRTSDDPLASAGHEGIEFAAMTVYGWSYSPAHVLATGGERRLVTKDGKAKWDPYVKALKPFIKATEHERLTKMPPDFDMRPILALPQDKLLILAVHEAMGSDKGKMDKQDKDRVHYDDRRGRPSHHCGPDHEWKEHSCEYFSAPMWCRLVKGVIATRGGCDLWESVDKG